jgi:hypothetical protein
MTAATTPPRRAGRPPGSANKKTREIADKAAQEGITPLEIMLKAMRAVYRRKGAVAAFPLAKDVAPYIHARIASVEHWTPPEGLAVVHRIERVVLKGTVATAAIIDASGDSQ